MLNDPYFEDVRQETVAGAYDPLQNLEVLKNIRAFQGSLKLQQAVMGFIQANIISNKEKHKMRQLFDAMDTDYDGHLTKNEIIGGLMRMGMSKM